MNIDLQKTIALAATKAIESIQEKQRASESVATAQKIGNMPSECPSALRDLPGWLIWKYEPGEKKPRKVPYYAAGSRRRGTQGSPEDRRQLATFDAAKAAAQRRGFEGVGLAILPEFGVVALDFDQCIVEGGVHPEVEKLVAGTYAEYSPSGQGVRAFMRGDLGNHKDNRAPYGFETFSSTGFVTFTGNQLINTELLGTGDTVADVTKEVKELAVLRFGRTAEKETDADPLMTYEPRLGLSPSQIEACMAVLDPDTGHDAWLHVGMALHHETDGDGFDYWNNWSAKGSKYPSEDVLRHRWDSFGSMAGRPVTARYLLKIANELGAGIDLGRASADDFDAITDEPADEDLRFRVVPAGEFSKGQAPGWIIKGVIPRAELVVLFGESGAGKSFVALDMAAAIARGIEWRGHRTKPGRVVYIAAEGGGGFRNRLRAYELHNKVGLDGLPFGIIHAAPNFLQKADALDVTKAIVAAGKADVVIVDTFAQVMPGANENAAEDIHLLKTFGITEGDWKIWKLASLEDYGHGNNTMLTPEGIAKISDDKLKAAGIIPPGATAEHAQIVRREAVVKYLGALHSESHNAIIEPGWKERSAMVGGLQRGNLRDEITRSFWQFKAFPIAQFARIWDIGLARPSMGGKAQFISAVLLMQTMAGAMMLQTQSLLSGQDPRPMDDWKFWLASFIKGGSLGIYGDFLYSQSGTTRYGSGPLEALAGPTIGTAATAVTAMVQAGNAMSEGKDTHLPAKLLGITKGMIPAENLWYTRAATDHIIFQNAQEALSPGYLANMRANSVRQFKQDWWWSPGKALPERAPNMGNAIGG